MRTRSWQIAALLGAAAGVLTALVWQPYRHGVCACACPFGLSHPGKTPVGYCPGPSLWPPLIGLTAVGIGVGLLAWAVVKLVRTPTGE